MNTLTQDSLFVWVVGECDVCICVLVHVRMCVEAEVKAECQCSVLSHLISETGSLTKPRIHQLATFTQVLGIQTQLHVLAVALMTGPSSPPLPKVFTQKREADILVHAASQTSRKQ